MSLSNSCCTVPPVVSNYKPKGTKVTINDMEVYKTGDPNSKAVLFGLYDIVGLHNNNYHICDMLADQGFYIILPDFFRGEGWSLDKIIPDNKQKLIDFGFVKHNWENTKKAIESILDGLKGEIKAEKRGIFGFCWGGKMVFEALSAKESIFHSGAGIHPSMITDQDISSVDKPILTILADEEANLLPKKDLLKSSVAENSRWLDYTDQKHGFCSARGDFGDPKTGAKVQEVVQEMTALFRKTLM